MQPASSSEDDDYSSDDDDDTGIVDRSIHSKNRTTASTTSNNERNPVSFDELPSDDSCLDDDSDSDNGSGSGGSSSSSVPSDDDSDSDAPPEDRSNNSNSNNINNDDDDYNDGNNNGYRTHETTEEEPSLAHRLDSKRNRGVVRNTYAGTAKIEALALARSRLHELKEKKKKKARKTAARTTNAAFFVDEHAAGDGTDGDGGDAETPPPVDRRERTGKKSRHAPTSASSLRSDYFQRGAPNLNASGVGVEVGANRYRPRDPRMEASTLTSATGANGVVDSDVFDQRYGFLEEIQDKEIAGLKERCRAWKLKGTKGTKKRRKMGLNFGEKSAEEDVEELERLMQERAERREDRLKRTARRSVNKKMKDEVASGQRGAFYLKKRDRKRMEMEAKFEELKKSGGNDALNKVLAKKRKKKRSKDASLMPRDMPFSR